MIKLKLLTAALLAGSTLLAVPAYAMQRELLREAAEIEGDGGGASSTRLSPVEQARQLEEQRRQQQLINSRTSLPGQANAPVTIQELREKQAEILEKSGNYLPEEIEKVRRGSNVVDSLATTPAIQDKVALDKAYKAQIQEINAQIRALQLKRAEITRTYHKDVAALAKESDLNFRPLTLPPEVITDVVDDSGMGPKRPKVVTDIIDDSGMGPKNKGDQPQIMPLPTYENNRGTATLPTNGGSITPGTVSGNGTTFGDTMIGGGAPDAEKRGRNFKAH